MAKLVAVVAFDMDAAQTLTQSFGLAGGQVGGTLTTPTTVYADRYSISDATKGLLVGGKDFAVNGNASFNGVLDANDAITGGTVQALLGVAVQDGVFKIHLGLEGIALSAVRLAEVAATAGAADDLNLLRSALQFGDFFDLSNKDDRARGFAGNDTLQGDGGVDRLYGGTENDTLFGGTGNDSLFGEAGSDKIVAGSGFDQLNGGAGRDILTGGTDGLRDFFLFQKAADSLLSARDEIREFTRDEDDGNPTDNDGDRIVLSPMDANLADADDDKFAWGGKTATANGVWWQTSGVDIIVRGDVTGDTTADFAVVLREVSSLTAEAFIL